MTYNNYCEITELLGKGFLTYTNEEEEINNYSRDIRPIPDFMCSVVSYFYELGKNSK